MAPLLAMLSPEREVKGRVAAARVLENLALDDDNKRLIPEAGGLPHLVANLSCADTECKIACAK
eukprot:scaffold651991_cov46-Prasinocladus_malaysianus.AAC.1